MPFGTRRRVREEALAWLARLKRGLRQNEGPELLAWLKRRSHRTIIAKAAVDWHGPDVLAILSELYPIDRAILEPRRGTHPAIMACAAGVAACLTFLPAELGLLAHFGLLRHRDPWIATTPDATKHLTLEDGTRVALNRGTRINSTMAEHIRNVFMARGEALFTVATDPYRTFEVRAGGREFETRSATFDIRLAGEDRLSITVLAGTVTVFPPLPRKGPDGSDEYGSDPTVYRPIPLEPGQMLIIEPDRESERTLTEGDLRSRLAWQRGA